VLIIIGLDHISDHNMNNITLNTALQTLKPGAIWILRGDTYAGLDWKDEVQTKPTEQELTNEIARLEGLVYQQQRTVEYPSVGDQLDALWKGGSAAEEMLAKVQAVKTKYPKP